MDPGDKHRDDNYSPPRSSTSSMLGRRGRGPLLLGITSRISSIGGTRKLHAAQKEWSRRFTPATMPASTDAAIETMPQMAMTLTMAGFPRCDAAATLHTDHNVCNCGEFKRDRQI